MADQELTRKTAHPKAAKLLEDDFFWSPIEESGPFGSDAGSDACYGFRDWRKTNLDKSPVHFLDELMARWAIPRFDVYEVNEDKVMGFVHKKTERSSEINLSDMKEMMKNLNLGVDDDTLQKIIQNAGESMGGRYLLEQDNAIIGIGFCQFAIEGKIDADIQNLTRIAISRQLLPCLLEQYSPDYQPTRQEQLSKMFTILNKMNE